MTSRSNLNWNRPTVLVRVKRWPEGIHVDACCADMVRRIDALHNTETRYSCCGHGIIPGAVEFASVMPRDWLERKIGQEIEPAKWQNYMGMTGWATVCPCNCGPEVRQAAREHFKGGSNA